MSPIDAVGWVGSILIVVAYVLITRRGVTIKTQALNYVGALALFANAIAHHAAPLVALNLVWMAIAVLGIEKLLASPKTRAEYLESTWD